MYLGIPKKKILWLFISIIIKNEKKIMKNIFFKRVLKGERKKYFFLKVKVYSKK